MNKILKQVRNVAISIAALLVVVVSGGLAYAWYSGEQADKNLQGLDQPAAAAVQPKVEPVKISQTGTIGASVQMLTSPITPGSNASIIVRTNPLATCTVTAVYNKVPSKDSGLIPKKADDYGVVEWAWTVESSVPLGTWPVTVTCANEKNSAVVRGDLEVVKTIEE